MSQHLQRPVILHQRQPAQRTRHHSAPARQPALLVLPRGTVGTAPPPETCDSETSQVHQVRKRTYAAASNVIHRIGLQVVPGLEPIQAMCLAHNMQTATTHQNLAPLAYCWIDRRLLVGCSMLNSDNQCCVEDRGHMSVMVQSELGVLVTMPLV